MQPRKILWTCLMSFTLVAWLGAASHPLIACVVCGSEGACYEQPGYLSGNCECSITEKFGALVCRPKGVCDPQDAYTCTKQPGQVIAAQGSQGSPVIHTRFLERVAAQDSLLAAALWGAMEEEQGEGGVVVRTLLSPGEHSGTMGTPDHRSFKYSVFVRQFADTLFVVAVTLQEEGTGETQKFDGALYERGDQGQLVRMDDGKGVPVAVWDLRPKPQREGQRPGASQD